MVVLLEEQLAPGGVDDRIVRGLPSRAAEERVGVLEAAQRPCGQPEPQQVGGRILGTAGQHRLQQPDTLLATPKIQVELSELEGGIPHGTGRDDAGKQLLGVGVTAAGNRGSGAQDDRTLIGRRLQRRVYLVELSGVERPRRYRGRGIIDSGCLA